MNPRTLVHRLLFEAMLEMRSEALANDNKAVFHLADLFHNAVLQMESAAADGSDAEYDEVLTKLRSRAKEQGCERWLEAAIKRIESRIPAQAGLDHS